MTRDIQRATKEGNFIYAQILLLAREDMKEENKLKGVKAGQPEKQMTNMFRPLFAELQYRRSINEWHHTPGYIDDILNGVSWASTSKDRNGPVSQKVLIKCMAALSIISPTNVKELLGVGTRQAAEFACMLRVIHNAMSMQLIKAPIYNDIMQDQMIEDYACDTQLYNEWLEEHPLKE